MVPQADNPPQGCAGRGEAGTRDGQPGSGLVIMGWELRVSRGSPVPPLPQPVSPSPFTASGGAPEIATASLHRAGGLLGAEAGAMCEDTRHSSPTQTPCAKSRGHRPPAPLLQQHLCCPGPSLFFSTTTEACRWLRPWAGRLGTWHLAGGKSRSLRGMTPGRDAPGGGVGWATIQPP